MSQLGFHSRLVIRVKLESLIEGSNLARNGSYELAIELNTMKADPFTPFYTGVNRILDFNTSTPW